jgi:hypothetical protein
MGILVDTSLSSSNRHTSIGPCLHPTQAPRSRRVFSTLKLPNAPGYCLRHDGPSVDGFLVALSNPTYKEWPHYAKRRAHRFFHLRPTDGQLELVSFLDSTIILSLHRLGVDFVAKSTNHAHETQPHHAKLRERQVFHFLLPDSLLHLAPFLDLTPMSAPAFGFMETISPDERPVQQLLHVHDIILLFLHLRTSFDLVIHRVLRTKPTCLSITRRPLWLRHFALVLHLNNTNQAASNTCNIRPRVSPYNIVNHSSWVHWQHVHHINIRIEHITT